nr:MAG TPA: hypothetical protein [Caudoviricetes sp.]
MIELVRKTLQLVSVPHIGGTQGPQWGNRTQQCLQPCLRRRQKRRAAAPHQRQKNGRIQKLIHFSSFLSMFSIRTASSWIALAVSTWACVCMVMRSQSRSLW